jgi:hypothetical protein
MSIYRQSNIDVGAHQSVPAGKQTDHTTFGIFLVARAYDAVPSTHRARLKFFGFHRRASSGFGFDG